MRQRVGIAAAWVVSGALAAVLGLIAVLILLDVDTAGIGSGPAATSVRLGAPIAWVTQDQSAYGPLPAGARVGFDSPMENPTSVSLPALGADVAIVAAVLAAVVVAAVFGVRRLMARQRQRRPA